MSSAAWSLEPRLVALVSYDHRRMSPRLLATPSVQPDLAECQERTSIQKPLCDLRAFLMLQVIEQRLRLFQHRRVEAFGEPVVDWREEITGFGAFALVTPEAR
jgi:hypothetical protein